jgi:hypothetical protein
MRWLRFFFWLFDIFWPFEVKIQNGEWIPFYQKFCMVFSSIMQNDKPKPKFFLYEIGELNTPLDF